MEARICESLRKLGERWLVTLLLLFSVFEVILTGISLFGLPGEMSLNRVILISISAFLGLVTIFLLVKNGSNLFWIPDWIRKTSTHLRMARRIESGLWVGIVVLWAIAFLPFSDLGRWGAVYVRLQPLLLLAFLIFVQALAGWFFFTRNSKYDNNSELKRPSFLPGLLFGAFITIIILVIGFTGWGIGVGTQYWGKAGVPILHWQIGLALGIVLSGLYLKSRFKHLRIRNWLLDLIIFACLWAATFLVWQAIPMAISRFTTRPYPPNYVSYPYSDAGDYVLSAESILLGSGFQYGYIDKPLHLTFLAMLRLLVGADFGKMILFQVGFLALIPGLIFLVASKISNRPAGLMASLIILFMQSNSLAAINRIQVSNVKMMMSEPLTAFMLLLVCLAIIAWWKNPISAWDYPALAGSILGLAGLVRLNTLVVAPFVAGVWLVSFGFKQRRTWLSVLVFALFCFLSLVPWMVRNQIKLGNPIEFIDSKTYGVIMKNRFNPVINDESEVVLQSGAPENPASEIPKKPIKKGITGLIQPMLHSGFHNLVAVGLVLPASQLHIGLDSTIRQPYWDIEWDGTFTPGGQVVFALSMLMVAIGFAASWRKQRILPLIPLVILIPYLLSNTYSLVSGGRYIVPVDWVLPVYFSIGITAALFWLLKVPTVSENIDSTKTIPAGINGWLKPEKLVGIVLLISCLPAGLSLLIPVKYPPADSVEILKSLKTNFPTIPAVSSYEDIQKFAKTEKAAIFRGQAMFPRWMKSGIGDTGGSGTAFSALPFDHLSFSLISYKYFPFDVLLPINSPISYLPNASEVIVVGCQTDTYFNAAIVFILSPQMAVYIRPDITKLECPFPQS
ncbi:MAG: hypothetical protein WCG34_05315 [Leptolinea sp.]